MTNLFYQEFGQNTDKTQAVILLHGLFGMSDNLTGLAKELSADHWVIVPDLINHGRSPHRQDMSYVSMAKDIIQLMDDLDIKQASVFGHSMGGKVAMQTAISFPSKVSKLIVADIAPVKYPESHNEIIQVMKQVAVAAIATRKEAGHILSEVVSDSALRQFLLKNLKRKDDGFWGWRLGLDEISNAYQLICDKPDLHSSYIKPTLFIKGGKSNYIKDEYKSEVGRVFPKANLKIIQDAGHWLHAEKPEIFNRIVRKFIAKQ